MPAIPVLKQVLVDVWFEFNPVHLTDAFEDLLEFGFCGMFNLYLVADAAQEGFVNQALGVEVGGENNQLVEGDFELHAGVHGHEIDLPVEVDDPAVQEALWVHLLAAEVIDDKETVVGLHL